MSTLDIFYAMIDAEPYVPADPKMKKIKFPDFLQFEGVRSESSEVQQSSDNDFMSKLFTGYYSARFNIGMINADKGYYDEVVYEALVHDLTAQGQIKVELELDLEFLRFYLTHIKLSFNFANIGVGLQWFLNTIRFDEMCVMMYYNYEILAFHNTMKTNSKTCQYSVVDNIRHPSSMSMLRKFKCQYQKNYISKVDLGNLGEWTPFPNYQILEFPATGCMF
eukprot:403369646